jgi:hypothetical protein
MNQLLGRTLAGLLILGPALHAGTLTVYDTFGPGLTTSTTDGLASCGASSSVTCYLGVMFSPNSTVALASLTVPWSASQSTLAVSLWTSGANQQPATQLASWSQAVTGAIANYTLIPTSQIILSSGNTYWVLVAIPNFTEISWGLSTSVPIQSGATFFSGTSPTALSGFIRNNYPLALDVEGAGAAVLGFQGGTSAAPAVLPGSIVAVVTGSISGQGSQNYYSFQWSGGAFSATASITGASNSASYLFSVGTTGSCNSANIALASGNSFTGSIPLPNLAPGQYCIGIDADNSNDPAFTLTFNTPVQGVTFFTGAVSVGAPWYYLQFSNGNLFGYYNFLQGSDSTASAVLYHADLGYEAELPGASAGSAYLYDFASGHWWYTSSSLFPYIYDFTLGAWIYYFPNTQSPGHYTANPRDFANLTTGATFTM